MQHLVCAHREGLPHTGRFAAHSGTVALDMEGTAIARFDVSLHGGYVL